MCTYVKTHFVLLEFSEVDKFGDKIIHFLSLVYCFDEALTDRRILLTFLNKYLQVAYD